jgi:hypothetical protein
MRASTWGEIKAESDQLERDAATVLGYMLFEYSRLDMELGLDLVWSDDGQKIEELTKKHSEHNFHKRLESLEKLVQLKYPDTPAALDLYTNWLSDAHAIRSNRNQLFHGRWGVSPQQQLVVNVMGLPTSPEQSETYYSIARLGEILQTMRTLRSRLSELRKTWPV